MRMADVFISYARADRGRVRLVALGLAAEGFSVWWDPEIQPGKKFDDVIRRELEASAAVVTCWTRAAAKSKWVLAETSFADGQKKLAPAVLQNCDPPIPYNMLQSADLTRWRGHADDPEWAALLARVKTLVDAKKRPVIAAAPPPGEAEAAQAPAASADAAPEPTQIVYDAERYMPSSLRGRAGGGGLGRAALAVVATAALTFGVLAAPEIIARVRSAIEMEPAPPLPPPPPPAPELAPDPSTFELAPAAEPLDAAAVESHAVETPTAATPPIIKPIAEPKPRPKPPQAGPTPVSTTPLPPAPDPRKPWTDLDACTQTLAARCGWRAPRAGFANDGTITAQEGAFLRTLGVETRQINTDVARQCQTVLQTATAAVDAAGKPTTLGTACGVKQAAQTLNPAAQAALAAGAAIVFGQIANGGRSDAQKPPSRQAPTRPAPTTGPN
jgi:hypothetical protein